MTHREQLYCADEKCGANNLGVCTNDPEQCLKRIVPFGQMEKDPLGIDQHAPGAKLDKGKPMAGLLQDFGLALLEVAKVSTFGAQKYSVRGWEQVPDGASRYSHAMIRHWLLERQGIDKDSGLLHMSQTAWNALARLELALRDMDAGIRKDIRGGNNGAYVGLPR
jgi:hypothetical protein